MIGIIDIFGGFGNQLFQLSFAKYLSKKNMYDIANKNGYHVFLEKTWSCWYPVNGKPCGRCVMCRERII